MKKQIIITLGCLAMLPGCDDTPDFEQHYVSENLVIGDLNAPGLVYVDLEPDSVIDPEPGEDKEIFFDVNGDGVTELSIRSRINLNRGRISTDCIVFGLLNVENSYELVADTYYQYTETINDTTEIHHLENQSDSPPSNSQISHTQMLSLTTYETNDTISKNNSVWRSTVQLGKQTIGTDTIGMNYATYDLRYGKWNGAGAKYGCFRFIKGREVYYGWIKLEVIDTKIVVHEYAYRKITEK